MRAGVAGGVLGTLAVAGASASTASAAEPVTQTLELPTLTADLADQVAQSADATQQTAANYQLQAERDAASANAAKQAKSDLAEAKKKAEAAKKKAAEEAAARKAAAEQASRSAARTTLATQASTGSGSGSGSSSADVSVGTSTGTGSVASVISFVKAQVGKAYIPGATGPSAYDCSGLVQTAFKQVGVSLPRVSQDQSTVGTQVSLSNLQPGDILYWGGSGSAYHVAVYVGGGMFVGAQNSSTGVVERPLSYDPPTGAVRVL